MPAEIREKIEQAGGPAGAGKWWTPGNIRDGARMPDESVDWIEAFVNEESPDGL